MTNFTFLRERLHAQAGISERQEPKKLQDLEQTEWSPEFERLMRNRMIMGALRYSTLLHKKITSKGKKQWDLIGSIKSKVEKYEQTGNTEFLVDIANYCLLAFECDPHPNKHFSSTDDSDHCKAL